MSDLPRGWVWATLDDLQASEPRAITDGPFGSNLTLSHYTDEGARVIRLQNIGDGRFIDERAYISLEHYDGLRSHSVRQGDLLVASLGQELPRVCLAPELGGPAIVKADCIRVRLHPGVEAKWVLYAMMAAPTRRYAANRIRGVGRPRLGLAEIRKIPVPIPPLAEQRRIVVALEDPLSRLLLAGGYVSTARRRLSAYRHSLIRAAVRGLLVDDKNVAPDGNDLIDQISARRTEVPGDWQVPSSWGWSTLGDLFEVHVGATPSRSNPDLWNGNIPWVSSGEVAFRRIVATKEQISEAAVGNRSTRIHPPGTVLLAMIGEGRTRGQVAILDIHAAHNQNCASIRVSDTPMLPEYVYMYLMGRYDETRRAGAGGNQLALNKSTIRAMRIPVPPLTTQRMIVDKIQDLLLLEGRMSSAFDLIAKRSSWLSSSLLANAFSGRLVPQDPNDEPASELLARIRAERAAVPPKQRAARGRRTQKDKPAPPTRAIGRDYQQGELPL